MNYHHFGFHGFSLYEKNNPLQNVTVLIVSVFTDFVFVVAVAKLKLGICVAHMQSVPRQSSLSFRTLHLLLLTMHFVFSRGWNWGREENSPGAKATYWD